MVKTLSSVLVVFAMAFAVVLAQAQKFEVASVKPNTSGGQFVNIGMQPGGRFIASNVPVRFLIRDAYQVQDFQIVGGPGWMSSDRFDINAKAEGDIPPRPPGSGAGPFQMMMRALLEERFKLATHQEKRDMPIYALVLARSDGKLGPQLQASTVDCAALRGRGRGPGGVPPGGPPPGPPSPTERPLCGMRITPGSLSGGGFPVSQLANILGPQVQRMVVDRTGLTGNFDFDLTWRPEQGPAASDSNGPSIFTALQEQLGLKLESTRDQVDVLVIDHIEPPTPD